MSSEIEETVDPTETAYVQGSRYAWRMMLFECLRNLGYDSPEWNANRWALEREDTVHALRSLCQNHGDNDWDDELNLSDVVRNHLENHVVERPQKS